MCLPWSQLAQVVLHCRLAEFAAAGSLAHSSSMYNADQGTLTNGVYCTEVATRQGSLTSSVYCTDVATKQGSLTSVVYCTDDAGGRRTCTCAALGQGAQLVQVSRQLFMSFVMARPRTLQIYLHKVNSICHFL